MTEEIIKEEKVTKNSIEEEEGLDLDELQSVFTDDEDEYYVYEASYAYPVNDGMTITPGIYTAEAAGGDTTGVIVKTSFSF